MHLPKLMAAKLEWHTRHQVLPYPCTCFFLSLHLLLT